MQLVGPLCLKSPLELFQLKPNVTCISQSFSSWMTDAQEESSADIFFSWREVFALMKTSEWGPEGEGGGTGSSRKGFGSKATPRCLIHATSGREWKSSSCESHSSETSQSRTNIINTVWPTVHIFNNNQKWFIYQ